MCPAGRRDQRAVLARAERRRVEWHARRQQRESQNTVSVYEIFEMENDVFWGPSTVFAIIASPREASSGCFFSWSQDVSESLGRGQSRSSRADHRARVRDNGSLRSRSACRSRRLRESGDHAHDIRSNASGARVTSGHDDPLCSRRRHRRQGPIAISSFEHVDPDTGAGERPANPGKRG